VELVGLLRTLARHRVVVALGVVLALLTGFMLTRGVTSTLGAASTHVLLDTPSSQLVDTEARAADSLAWRSAFLTDVMATDEVSARVAREAGVRRRDLLVRTPDTSEAANPSPLATGALDAAAARPEPYVLLIRSADPLPMIAIEASARTPAAAAKLVVAAREVMNQEAVTPAGTDDPMHFSVEPTGPVKTRLITSGPNKAFAIVGAILVFVLWVIVIAVASFLRRTLFAPTRQSLAPAG
jgi:hypothetical protein